MPFGGLAPAPGGAGHGYFQCVGSARVPDGRALSCQATGVGGGISSPRAAGAAFEDGGLAGDEDSRLQVWVSRVGQGLSCPGVHDGAALPTHCHQDTVAARRLLRPVPPGACVQPARGTGVRPAGGP